MANVLLTYDIKETTKTIHTELKNQLIQTYGYSKTILGSDGKYYTLPNTALYKTNITSQRSSIDFVAACNEVGAIWEKYIAAETLLMSTFDNQ